MRLLGLLGFITVMWTMILAITAFLINFVAPIDFFLFRNGLDRFIISLMQASIAIVIIHHNPLFCTDFVAGIK